MQNSAASDQSWLTITVESKSLHVLTRSFPKCSNSVCDIDFVISSRCAGVWSEKKQENYRRTHRRKRKEKERQSEGQNYLSLAYLSTTRAQKFRKGSFGGGWWKQQFQPHVSRFVNAVFGLLWWQRNINGDAIWRGRIYFIFYPDHRLGNTATHDVWWRYDMRWET